MGEFLGWLYAQAGGIVAVAGVGVLAGGAARTAIRAARTVSETVPAIAERLEGHCAADEEAFASLGETLDLIRVDIQVLRNDVGWLRDRQAVPHRWDGRERRRE